ncbi:hypothetical protein Hanom_Chr13g01196471 [Helianthus anomalus]
MEKKTVDKHVQDSKMQFKKWKPCENAITPTGRQNMAAQRWGRKLSISHHRN